MAPVETHWKTGEQILLRYLRNKPGEVVEPVRVVHDGEDYTALYMAVGTPLKVRATHDGQRLTREIPFLEREGTIGGFVDAEWTTNHALMLHQPGRMSAIMLFWRGPEWEFVGFYGNIQAPLARTELGFDTADYLLDVWIRPNHTWEWKDEDEWELAREHGLIDAGLLDEARREGERIIVDVESRVWPFNAGFESWRPEPAWPVPEMPVNWSDGLEYPR